MKKISAFVAAFAAAVFAVSAVSFSASAAVPGSNELISMRYDNTQAKSMQSSGFPSLPALSRDGNFAVLFTYPGDDALTTPVSSKQAVVRNLKTQTNELASISPSGAEANYQVDTATLSENGQFIIFNSNATNLVSSVSTYTGYAQTYIRDRVNNTVEVASISNSGTLANAPTVPRAVSNDGRFVLFYTYASAFGASQNQLFLKDMITGDLELISKSEAGVMGNSGLTTGTMSCDGSFIAFMSGASNLVPNDTNNTSDAFLVDLRNGFKITSITPNANKDAIVTDISCNGNYVAFYSASTGLTPETVTGTYTHVFLYNRLTKSTVIVDKNYYNGQVTPASTSLPAVSDKGHVVFSADPNTSLVPSPYHGGKRQIYIRDTQAGTTQMLSVTSAGVAGNNDSIGPNTITSDGTKASYRTIATNLSSTTDTNATYDYYLSVTGY